MNQWVYINGKLKLSKSVGQKKLSFKLRYEQSMIITDHTDLSVISNRAINANNNISNINNKNSNQDNNKP